MKTIEYQVFDDFGMLLVVAAMCGGSDDVRYGRHGPETRYVAELEPKAGEMLWVFVHLPSDGRVAARVQWRDDLWTVLSSHGIQAADCPFEVWYSMTSRYVRAENLFNPALPFEQALRLHVDAKPGTVRTAEFLVPA